MDNAPLQEAVEAYKDTATHKGIMQVDEHATLAQQRTLTPTNCYHLSSDACLSTEEQTLIDDWIDEHMVQTNEAQCLDEDFEYRVESFTTQTKRNVVDIEEIVQDAIQTYTKQPMVTTNDLIITTMNDKSNRSTRANQKWPTFMVANQPFYKTIKPNLKYRTIRQPFDLDRCYYMGR